MPKLAQQGDLQPIINSILASTATHNALALEVLVELAGDRPDKIIWLTALLSRAHDRERFDFYSSGREI